MRERRGLDRIEQLCSGPGKLTQALGVELAENDTPLTGTGPIAIAPPPADWPAIDVVTGERIGITKAVELPWRFCLRDSRHVSKPWPAAS